MLTPSADPTIQRAADPRTTLVADCTGDARMRPLAALRRWLVVLREEPRSRTVKDLFDGSLPSSAYADRALRALACDDQALRQLLDLDPRNVSDEVFWAGHKLLEAAGADGRDKLFVLGADELDDSSLAFLVYLAANATDNLTISLMCADLDAADRLGALVSARVSPTGFELSAPGPQLNPLAFPDELRLALSMRLWPEALRLTSAYAASGREVVPDLLDDVMFANVINHSLKYAFPREFERDGLAEDAARRLESARASDDVRLRAQAHLATAFALHMWRASSDDGGIALRQCLEEAEAEGRAADDPDTVALAMYGQGRERWLGDDANGSTEWFLRTYEYSVRHDLTSVAMQSARNLVTVANLLGHDDGDHWLHVLEDYVERTGDRLSMLYTGTYWARLLDGDVKEAERQAARYMEAARDLRPEQAVHFRVALAMARAFGGSHAEALATADKAIAESEAKRDRWNDALARIARGWSLVRIGEVDAGLTELREDDERWLRQRDEGRRGLAIVVLALAEAAVLAPEALDDATRAAEIFVKVGDKVGAEYARLARASALFSGGDLDSAREAALAALESATTQVIRRWAGALAIDTGALDPQVELGAPVGFVDAEAALALARGLRLGETAGSTLRAKALELLECQGPCFDLARALCAAGRPIDRLVAELGAASGVDPATVARRVEARSRIAGTGGGASSVRTAC